MNMRKDLQRLVALCWFSVAFVASFANDGIYYTSGNQLLPLVATDIHVWREVLTLLWGDDPTAGVDVYYAYDEAG